MSFFKLHNCIQSVTLRYSRSCFTSFNLKLIIESYVEMVNVKLLCLIRYKVNRTFLRHQKLLIMCAFVKFKPLIFLAQSRLSLCEGEA